MDYKIFGLDHPASQAEVDAAKAEGKLKLVMGAHLVEGAWVQKIFGITIDGVAFDTREGAKTKEFPEYRYTEDYTGRHARTPLSFAAHQ